MNPEKEAVSPDSGTNKYLAIYKNRKQIIWNNFLGGLAWSFGTFIGLGILTIIIGFVITRIDLVPIIGGWIAQILQDATSRVQPPIK